MSTENTPKFSEALAELDGILRKLQSNDCDIDSLTTLTKRATELITLCRERLTATDAELRGILTSLQGESAE